VIPLSLARIAELTGGQLAGGDLVVAQDGANGASVDHDRAAHQRAVDQQATAHGERADGDIGKQ